MIKKPLLSPELLRQLFRYEPETGKLFWRERPREMFATKRAYAVWNTRFPGKEALATSCGGYLQGRLFFHTYHSHRVIWAMETGAWPTDQLDHIDHDRANNRIENLREVSPTENCRNQSRANNNTSGINGVSWYKRHKKWQARIVVSGQRIHLGYFEDIQAAAAARDAADIKYGFHKNHGTPALYETFYG